MCRELFQAYAGVFSIFRKYWLAYGSFKALVLSPYLHMSILATALFYPYWILAAWWDMPIGILPNMIGFAIGSYAILLSFGDQKFLQFIAEKNQDTDSSAFIVVSSTFAHFIVVQIIALFFAIAAKSTHVNHVNIDWLKSLIRSINLQPAYVLELLSI